MSIDDNELSLLRAALDQTEQLLEGVTPDVLAEQTPCAGWDVATLADHVVAAPVGFATMVRGEQPDWGAPAPHVAGDWAGEFRGHADALLTEIDSRGDSPAPLAMELAELATHGWDLATALGRPLDRLDPHVAEAGLAFMRSSLKPEMRGDAFDEEQAVPEGAGPYVRLAAFAGRRV